MDMVLPALSIVHSSMWCVVDCVVLRDRKPSWKDGSTAVAVLLVDNTIYIGNLGDSKVCLSVCQPSVCSDVEWYEATVRCPIQAAPIKNNPVEKKICILAMVVCQVAGNTAWSHMAHEFLLANCCKLLILVDNTIYIGSLGDSKVCQ